MPSLSPLERPAPKPPSPTLDPAQQHAALARAAGGRSAADTALNWARGNLPDSSIESLGEKLADPRRADGAARAIASLHRQATAPPPPAAPTAPQPVGGVMPYRSPREMHADQRRAARELGAWNLDAGVMNRLAVTPDSIKRS